MASNLEFIKEVKAVASSIVEVTNVFTTKYDVYKIYARFTGNSSTGYLSCRYIDTGGNIITDSEYRNATINMRTYDAYFESRGTTNTSMLLAYNQDFGGGAADFTVYNPVIAEPTHAKMFSMGGTNTSGYGWAMERATVHSPSESITGIAFLASDFNDIQISVYGVK